MLSRVKESKILTKCILAASAVLILLLGSYAVLRFGFGIDLLARPGWSGAGGVVRYLDSRGRPLLQWQTIDGKRYYFAADDGHMLTGWCQIENDRYYFDENGVCASGLQTVEGVCYGFAPDGAVLRGWHTVSGTRYCFAFDGSMYTGWQSIDAKLYYFTPEGTTLSGWQELDGARYYFTAEGHTLSGLQMLDGKHYLFHAAGYVLTGWQEVDGARCCFALDGSAMQGWFSDKTGTYFFAEDGTMTTGWLTQGEDRYYFHADGTMAVGEVKIDGVSHFFAANGKYILLVNAANPVPADYTLDLVDYGSYKIDRGACDALDAMLKDCRKAGYSCSVNNIYRSEDVQQYLWNRTLNGHMANGMTYEQAYIETGKDTALPGHSEHQTGLAVDFNGWSAYGWLSEHCWEYGFIVRYPEDCYEHTGIIYEPWHLRYVGVEFALELRDSGLCLEEYMDKLTNS